MGGRVGDWAQKQQEEELETGGRRRSTRLRESVRRGAMLRGMPGAFDEDVDV
jgi:hypothetical protein